jgi:hypothetical protein
MAVNQLLGLLLGGFDICANQINSHLDMPVVIKEISPVSVHRLHWGGIGGQSGDPYCLWMMMMSGGIVGSAGGGVAPVLALCALSK